MSPAAGKGVLERVVEWAHGEDTVRAVLLGGSRAADPDGVDDLSGYDVVLVLSDPGVLTADADYETLAEGSGGRRSTWRGTWCATRSWPRATASSP